MNNINLAIIYSIEDEYQKLCLGDTKFQVKIEVERTSELELPQRDNLYLLELNYHYTN
jgi:hypothetical protein